jgi:hypothetical protein
MNFTVYPKRINPIAEKTVEPVHQKAKEKWGATHWFGAGNGIRAFYKLLPSGVLVRVAVEKR